MFGFSLKEKINKWTDEEVLENLLLFLNDRVQAGVHFVTNDDGLIVGYSTVLVVGDKMVPSEPIVLDWPWQPMPLPEAFNKKELH